MISIDKTSIVESESIGDGTIIEEFCVIRKNVILGKGVHIYPHVIIFEGSVIGDYTRLYPGTFVGKVPDGAGALARTPHYSNYISIGLNCAIVYPNVKASRKCNHQLFEIPVCMGPPVFTAWHVIYVVYPPYIKIYVNTTFHKC